MSEGQDHIPLRIDIVSDVVCPWCIIGYKQLQRALDQLGDVFEPDIHWQPFELNPGMPAEGQDLGEHLAQKYGAPPEQGRAVRERLTRLGESLGFHFDYRDDMRIYNTFRAHQLLHWAGTLGKQTELQLALFEAFFSRGENVGDSGSLARVAARVGLDRDDARRVLDSERYAATVREEQAGWLEREVHAVPTFFFNGGYPVPGAQEPETFVRLLGRLRDREAAASP
jgi:predicted DsbA family dithiol-disulfide isomerase